MAESKVVYRPCADATQESELSAVVAAYRFLLFDCHARKKGPRPGAPDAARKGN
jgi:hypothetical protein